MIYQYDQALQLPTVDLYDTLLMAMALNAAKDMYEKGELQIKDFLKAYGDFLTPITADLDWWNLNVTGRVRDAINQMYARGGDPLRNALDRALLSMLINNMPYGDMAKLKTSAENAKQYLNERAKLEAAGLYNPLFAKYEGYDTNTYNTLDNGIWDKISPTKITDMATFGNPYFEGMKPNIHRESKNGIDYTIESITEDDLKNIADAHFNELVSTPQGQLMFKYYRDLAGGDSNPEANKKAREMFNNAVSDAQRRRIYTKDDYDDQWAKRQQLSQGWAKIAQDERELQLKRDQFEWEKGYYERQLNPSNVSSSSSSSGSGAGSSSNDLPTQGTATMVSYDLDKQYMLVKEDFENKRKSEERAAYSKLGNDKSLTNTYKNAYKTINNSKASSAQKETARKIMNNLENRSKEFGDWAKSYRYLNDDTAWSRYSTSIGKDTPWGQEQDASILTQKAHEAFYRQNILNSPLDIGARQDMNHVLGIVEDEDGKKVGMVTQGTDFAPVAEADFTGNRTYKYNHNISKLNRLLKGRHYEISAKNESGREYGSGTINGAKYNIVVQRALFDDADIKEEIDKWSPAEKQAVGVVASGNGYEIPIITKYSGGSYTWANVNTETDKRIGGTSEATRQRPTRLAGTVLRKIQ